MSDSITDSANVAGALVSLAHRESYSEISINRSAALNALNEEVLSGLSGQIAVLADAFTHGAAHGTVPCHSVVIRSEGEKAFVAGADIKLMQGANPLEFQRYVLLGQRVMRQLEELPVPVLARVQGFALGGGFELALACDLIIASEKASFGQPEINLGLIPGFGGSQRLAARIGRAKTKRLVFTGESVPAKDALDMGLVDYVAAPELLDTKVGELVALFAAKSPLALAAAKRAVDSYFEPALRSGLLAEGEEFLAITRTADAREGLSAFVEKRKPKFSGK